MNLLLDTHILIWAALAPGRLSDETAALIVDEANRLHFSTASIWEVAIKHGLGRPDFTLPPAILWRSLVDNGYLEVPVTGAHAIAVGDLAPLHKDPFDRLLLAQARVEGLLLLTADDRICGYGGPVRRALVTPP
ncbi:type II toxin-antitoxin system VapC family toxin [Zavarzinia compransoris]|uniref:PIN domain nuclease n=1 Tax=Zavarzinia compransoris TaxID=1264899 RepID=A0A317EB27_9PROT|nr:type II toxin-antitoxin system VapC family toxin [Zavarzinia compransoris]PWR23406.1 PIN domain nuclease [Zavarzinia compransoris]TDP46018.1 PIN domain nuclease of toxin-antitoxin system [Zavarzinia compransoris]